MSNVSELDIRAVKGVLSNRQYVIHETHEARHAHHC